MALVSRRRLTGDLPGQEHHLVLADLVGLDHDADLPARLDGKGLFHAGEGGGDLLQLLQALDIVLQVLPPGAGPGGGDGVGRLNQAGHHRLGLHVVVVGVDGVDDGLALVVLPGQLHADGDVGALHLVVDGPAPRRW